ncbi:MAG: DUF2231 domain-containing protein [Thermoleophilia bacterium]
MIGLGELHAATTHLAVVALPLYALLLILRRAGITAWAHSEVWVLGAAVAGMLASGITGLIVRGESLTELRGNDNTIGAVHFYLGIAIAVVLLIAAGIRFRRLRRGQTFTPALPVVVVAVLLAGAVFGQGYFGGKMTYAHGVGVDALGQGAQTAVGSRDLAVALATGTPVVDAGKQAFGADGLGCATCHGDLAEGARGPRLAGGVELEHFRGVHGGGLFPARVVTDEQFDAVNAYLKTLGPPGG